MLGKVRLRDNTSETWRGKHARAAGLEGRSDRSIAADDCVSVRKPKIGARGVQIGASPPTIAFLSVLLPFATLVRLRDVVGRRGFPAKTPETQSMTSEHRRRNCLSVLLPLATLVRLRDLLGAGGLPAKTPKALRDVVRSRGVTPGFHRKRRKPKASHRSIAAKNCLSVFLPLAPLLRLHKLGKGLPND